ncbi:MAG: glycosyltransferase family 2 protein [Planctomycetota bacterium]|nr:glycosyltransferase family 2 protein [Planctomycetota bacterium]MEC8560287.1 glycosyltransferase family 2 protein [Planctomycetota bacterium]MEC8734244.1 glycosyltransferase family 2 protein [Planctomycetota bacterium]MEC8818890.1 glycosyltransferase family 2 protein [Planctomycetota bacterium]MEC9157158.1 glycosyltransferase family 2 protein [Planctomycetota bacterium]
MSADVTVLILTKNEEFNLPHALESVSSFARRVVVVDSGSTDRTLEIAREAGADVYENEWYNYATQLNWGLDNTGIDTTWTFRLDADEVVLPELQKFFLEGIDSVAEDVDGIEIRRRMYFLGRWIRHGGIYPSYMVRIFKTGRVRCEMSLMDEHMVVEGAIHRVEADIKDDNTKSIRWWTAKHNWYSDRELFDILERQGTGGGAELVVPRLFGTPVERKRWMKTKVYARVPLMFRSTLYYLYRYYLRLGFLDGREGQIYHFLQAYWYRFLVDAKFFETNRNPRIKEELVEEIYQSLKD